MEKNLFAWPWSFAQKIVDLFGKLFSLSMRQLKELQANITLSFLFFCLYSLWPGHKQKTVDFLKNT